ncbi:MAG: YCF48-related protein, partial [Syntrophothermus sp.]
IHFTDNDTGWALGTKLSKTTDGGMNWKTIDIKYSGYLYSIDFSNDTGWIGGSGGLILKSTDNGNTWLRLSERKRQFNAVHFCDTENGWAVGDSGVIMHTNDGGNNWELQYQSDGGIKLNSVFAISRDKAICVGNELKVTPQGEKSFGVIMKTSDRGFTWVKTLSDSTGVYNSVKFINNSGWIAGSTGNVVKTTDGGDSWCEIKTNLPDNSYFETMDFVSEKAGWIAEHNSFSLYKTVDGGGNWVNQVIDSGLSLTSFDFVDQDYGWAAGEYQSSGNFFKTTDGGNSWLAKKIPEIRDLTSVSFLNRNTGWVIGYNALFDILTSYIAKTTDGGENWSVRKLPVKNAEYCIYMVNDNVGYIAGDGILKTENGGLSTLPLSGKKSIPGGIALYQNYPNPFNPSTTIRYTINRPDHVSLKIYDILGKLVKVLVDEWQREGEHKVTWTAGNLASGIYFCRLSSGKYSETKKIMMIQ